MKNVALEGLKELLNVDHEWIPKVRRYFFIYSSIYYCNSAVTRSSPFSNFISLLLLCHQLGLTIKKGFNRLKLLLKVDMFGLLQVEQVNAKTAGNYASSLKAQEVAEERVFTSTLVDGVERKYVEEVGSMNIFFKINGEVVTPSLNGSILPGITRDSIIHLLNHWNVPTVERKSFDGRSISST